MVVVDMILIESGLVKFPRIINVYTILISSLNIRIF